MPVKVFKEEDVKKMSFGRSSKIEEIKTALKETHLTKPGTCCLLNEIVKEFGNGSNSGLHSQLKGALKRDACFNVVKEQDRLIVVRVA